MSALLLFVILFLAGLFMFALGKRVRGPLKFPAVVGGIALAIIGFYGIFTYFL